MRFLRVTLATLVMVALLVPGAALAQTGDETTQTTEVSDTTQTTDSTTEESTTDEGTVDDSTGTVDEGTTEEGTTEEGTTEEGTTDDGATDESAAEDGTTDQTDESEPDVVIETGSVASVTPLYEEGADPETAAPIGYEVVVTLSDGTTQTLSYAPDATVDVLVDGNITPVAVSELQAGAELVLSVTVVEPEPSEIKLSGEVLEVVPPSGEEPGYLIVLVAGKEVQVPISADMELEGIEVGSYVELKGTTEAIEEIEVKDEDEDEQESELKGSLVSVEAGAEGEGGSITLMIGGQEITFTAEELGLTAEAMELLVAGAEFKLESEGDELELKISGEAGEVKVEVKDGETEIKIEPADEEDEEKWAEKAREKAEKAREKAREKAEKAREKARKHAEKARERARKAERKAWESDDHDDDDDEDDRDDEESEDEDEED